MMIINITSFLPLLEPEEYCKSCCACFGAFGIGRLQKNKNDFFKMI